MTDPNVSIPRLLVAGTSSGVGKTTVMVGLTQALRQRGLRVAVFKCGPDYLDPTYHARASGVACHNLDGWMMGRDAVLFTFARAARGADVALIEGVMGLYDGASPTSEEGSAAEIAKWLTAPVLAVVDGAGMARTIAALGVGLAHFDRELHLEGLWANRVGSRGHLDLLRSACARGGSPPLLGGLPEREDLAFPERHLGLHAASREVLSDGRLAAWGTLVEEWCEVDALLRIAGEAPAIDLPTAPAVRTAERTQHPRCRIGIARDAAFHFYYDDNLRRLELLGAELVPFSPIADRAPPPVDGLYLGGGYPELYAGELQANDSMRTAIRSFIDEGGPVYAECGGLMYLAQGIRTLDGRDHEMVGVVPGVAVMCDRLQALGYVEVETQRPTVLGDVGLRLRGHQFRYSRLEGDVGQSPVYRVRRRRDGSTETEGWAGANVLASYVHTHWASNPLCAEGLVSSCAAFAVARR